MKVLFLNQCFWPDVVATAQQLTDVAVSLAERGQDVTVIASNRGYDNPEIHFPGHERWKGITIRRIRTIAAEKKTRWRRAVNFGSFLVACALRLLFTPRQDVVVVLTSPPLISWLGSIFTRLKGGRLVFWVMDLNPDEAIAAGWLRSNSLTAKVLSALLKSSMQRSDTIIALDRFVKDRIVSKGIAEEKVEIISPWSSDRVAGFDERGREAFRREYGLSEKFVVMYAGNHSPCHPLDTVLDVALVMRERRDIAFCFVGGGSEQRKVREFSRHNQLENILCLPYQPMSNLSASLSAADMHVIVMGESFPGIVHPSKIYNILAIGIPFLYIGPPASHVTDIVGQLRDRNVAKVARHGETARITRYITEGAETYRRALPRNDAELGCQFSKNSLLPRLIGLLEATDKETEGLRTTVQAAKAHSA